MADALHFIAARGVVMRSSGVSSCSHHHLLVGCPSHVSALIIISVCKAVQCVEVMIYQPHAWLRLFSFFSLFEFFDRLRYNGHHLLCMVDEEP